MTEKHYEAIAAGFAAQLKAHTGAAKITDMDPAILEFILFAVWKSAEMFANIAEADNASFDRARFFSACGFGGLTFNL